MAQPNVLLDLQEMVGRAPSLDYATPIFDYYPSITNGADATGSGANGSLGSLPAFRIGGNGSVILRQQRGVTSGLDIIGNGYTAESEATGDLVRFFTAHSNYTAGTWGHKFTTGGFTSVLSFNLSGHKQNVGGTWQNFAASAAPAMLSVVPDTILGVQIRSSRDDGVNLNSRAALECLSDLTTVEATAASRTAYQAAYKHAYRLRITPQGEFYAGYVLPTFDGNPLVVNGASEPAANVAANSAFDASFYRSAAGCWRFNDKLGVGISPSFPIHAYQAAGGYMMRLDSAVSQFFWFEDGAGNWEVGTSANKYIAFDTQGTPRLTILGNGRCRFHQFPALADSAAPTAASSVSGLSGVIPIYNEAGTAIRGYVPLYGSFA